MFPTLPVGVVHDHDIFQPKESYHVCEFLLDQYAARKGDLVKFRDAGLALGRRDDMSIVFSLNIINGGIQASRDGAWDCSPTQTGGRGGRQPNCRMTAEQVRDWGILLGSAGCALTMWRYDPDFVTALADRTLQRYDIEDLRFGKAFAVGVSQILALMPGTSRPGT